MKVKVNLICLLKYVYVMVSNFIHYFIRSWLLLLFTGYTKHHILHLKRYILFNQTLLEVRTFIILFEKPAKFVLKYSFNETCFSVLLMNSDRRQLPHKLYMKIGRIVKQKYDVNWCQILAPSVRYFLRNRGTGKYIGEKQILLFLRE